MQSIRRLKKFACVCVAGAFFGTQVGPLQAGLVPTQSVFEEAAISVQRSDLLALADREAVRGQLQALGLSPDLASQRIARMSDREVAELQAKLDTLPAGGDALGTLAFIFIVLLITDIAGLTDIFPFVKK